MTTDERILEALIEIKQEVVGNTLAVQGLSDHVGKQNGRIGKLEDWKLTMDLAAAHASGVKEGKAGMVVSRKLVAGVVATLTAMIGATGGIVAIVMDLR